MISYHSFATVNYFVNTFGVDNTIQRAPQIKRLYKVDWAVLKTIEYLCYQRFKAG